MRKSKAQKILTIFLVMAMLFSSVMVFASCRKYIVVGVEENYEPFSYKNKDGDFVGFDIGYLSLLSQELGVEIKIKSVKWIEAEKKLNDGEIDALWNFSKTASREKRLLFTESYLQDSAALIVREASGASLDYFESISKIAVQKVSTQDEWIAEKELTDKAVYCESSSDAMKKLESSEVDAALVDLAFAKYYLQHININSSVKLAILEENLYQLTCNAGLKIGNEALAEKLSNGILAVNNSEAFKTICNKWFGTVDGFR